MGHKYSTCSIQHMRTTWNCPTTKLASFLFKEKRLSQAYLELSSSRGLFGSLENKRKRREKREHQTLTKAARYLHKNIRAPQFLSLLLLVTKTMGVYIVHPLCETTITPNTLAKIRDKGVIHQMRSVCINYKRMTRQAISLGTTISLCRENFAR